MKCDPPTTWSTLIRFADMPPKKSPVPNAAAVVRLRRIDTRTRYVRLPMEPQETLGTKSRETPVVPAFALLWTYPPTPTSEEIMSVKKFAIAATIVASSALTGIAGSVLAIGIYNI